MKRRTFIIIMAAVLLYLRVPPVAALIAVAVIYFILGGVFTALIALSEKIFSPKHRNRDDILKGVRTGD